MLISSRKERRRERVRVRAWAVGSCSAAGRGICSRPRDARVGIAGVRSCGWEKVVCVVDGGGGRGGMR